jgi:hypothetical protein
MAGSLQLTIKLNYYGTSYWLSMNVWTVPFGYEAFFLAVLLLRAFLFYAPVTKIKANRQMGRIFFIKFLLRIKY